MYLINVLNMEHNKPHFVVMFFPNQAGRQQSFNKFIIRFHSQRDTKLLLPEFCDADSTTFGCRPPEVAVARVL
jgi:hypothetical protein